MTTSEHLQLPELTPEDIELGELLITMAGLEDVADCELEDHGMRATVRYGLAHSGKYLIDRMTPEELRFDVMARLEFERTRSAEKQEN